MKSDFSFWQFNVEEAVKLHDFLRGTQKVTTLDKFLSHLEKRQIFGGSFCVNLVSNILELLSKTFSTTQTEMFTLTTTAHMPKIDQNSTSFMYQLLRRTLEK